MYGWLASGNLNIQCLGEVKQINEYAQYHNLLNKFPDDKISTEKDNEIFFLDGFIYNKTDFKQEYKEQNWQSAFIKAIKQGEECLKKLRGGFCGFNYNKISKSVFAYTDQTSIKSLYYYINGTQWMLSSSVELMVKVLKANHLSLDFNVLAAQYMLTYGYMLDDSTFAKQVRRLLPGKCLYINNGHAEVKRYHSINNTVKEISEKEAVEQIDLAFRNAVQREFQKDKEYGYEHLVDLSGGLDSRMVSWVAHDLGYKNQINITYSQMGYSDEKISKQIAKYLGHEYIYKALDDAQWMYDIDDIVSMNNGAALYMGITGGSRFLNSIKTERFGIEHTGMIGDAILSSFYSEKKFNYGKPQFGYHKYSGKLKYEFDNKILDEYPFQEMFAIYTRGILGAQSSYMIRQNYIEPASPFMDVDFLDVVFSIPFEYRCKHYIYLKWMLEKYPKATEFGWEKWGNVKPKRSHIIFRKMKTTERLIQQHICNIFQLDNQDTMTPVDYWYSKNGNIQKFFQQYYQNVNLNSILGDELKKDMDIMFAHGNVLEKSMVLTVVAMIKKYFM